MDAGYKTPWIAKRVIDDGIIPVLPYKRPMGKKGFFAPYEYIYDEYYNCVICPENHVLSYSTTNREGYCGCCDHALNVVNGRHYKCKFSEKISELDCHRLSIPIKELEAVVFDTLRAQTSCVTGSIDLKRSIELSSAQQAEYNKKLRGLQDSKRELYESLVLGEIGADDYKARKAEMDVLIADVKNVIAAAAAGVNAAREEYEENLRQKKIADELNAADSLTKSLVELMIKRVYVFPDNRIEIEYLSGSPFEG